MGRSSRWLTRGIFVPRPFLELLEDRTVPAHFYNFVDPSPSVGNGFGSAIVPLASGNVVVTAPYDDSGATNAGAVYLFNGSTGVLISTLKGSQPNDQVGGSGVTALTKGNFVVSSPDWANGAATNAGAVTWGSGTTGVKGVVSAANSLIGSKTGDQVGYMTALSNGNYVVKSPDWDNGTATNAGAVTWGSGITGVKGVVSAGNSLVGSRTNDQVGSYGVTALSNGNFVVKSPNWDNGAATNAGALTWGSGATGVKGAVSAANSLVGSKTDDGVGSNGSVTALSNGNFVVKSPFWDNGAVLNAGAVTWGSGTTGVKGVVSAGNSLIGSQTNDGVGSDVSALTNGNFVVSSPNWDNGAATNAGAVTWGSGTTGVKGIVSTANSLVGSKTDDLVGGMYYDGVVWGNGVTALSNGNFVVSSLNWANGAATQAGAVTWGNGTTGVKGVVSATNSLVGSKTDDWVGGMYYGVLVGRNGVTALSNGNFVVSSPNWDFIWAPTPGFFKFETDAGAVTWGNGTTGVKGVVSATNSLVGSKTNDYVGSGGVTALSNSNFVVPSPNWANGAATEAGAVTWGSGTTGIKGVVSAANSLVGSKTGDQVGSGEVTVLTNGNFVVPSPNWANGAATDAGAVTWGNGTTGVKGVVSTANSLVGSQTSDYVGSGHVTALSNGNYVVRSSSWANGTATDAGAVTWGNGTTGVKGVVSAANSLVGSKTDDLVGGGAQVGSGYGVTALSNGNYVVSSQFWANGAATDAGAVTWGSGITGIKGIVSTANSLVGSKTDDRVGFHATALSNGNYLVKSPYFDLGLTQNTGIINSLHGALSTSGPALYQYFVGGVKSGGSNSGFDEVVVDYVNNHFYVLFPAGAYGQAGGYLAVGSLTPSGLLPKVIPILTTTPGVVSGVSLWGTGGVKLGSINPYPGYTGRILTAVGDVNGDKYPDIVTGRGAGVSALVKVFDGKTLKEASSFNAYAPNFLGGITLALADTDGDGVAEIITGTGNGSVPHVKVMKSDGFVVASFYAYATDFTKGVNLATGDMNGDGKADIVTWPNPGGGPHVRVFQALPDGKFKADKDGKGVASASFFAYDSKYTGGFSLALGDVDGVAGLEILTMRGPTTPLFTGVATARRFSASGVLQKEWTPIAGLTQGGQILAGDLNMDSIAEVIVAAGVGAESKLVVTDGMGTVHAQKTVYLLPFKSGFNMSLVDLNGDGVMEIAVAPGAGIAGLVQRFDHNLTLLDSFFALDSSYTGGVWLK